MIISHKKNFCFIHIPKNGGTYIKSILSRFHDDKITFYGVYKINERKVDLCHLNMNDLMCLFNKVKEQSYNKICFIRDPIERFKSGYIEYLNHIKVYFNEKPLCIDTILDKMLHSDFDSTDCRYIHLIPQTYYTHDCDGNRIVDHIINLKNITSSLNNILFELDIDIDINKHNKICNNGKSTKFDSMYVLNDIHLSKLKKVYFNDYLLLDFQC